jgi:glycerol-3-phosphate dehydrogenase (NAD(P)+)
MEHERHNPRYVSEMRFPATLHATSSLSEALAGQDVVVHSVPSHATRTFARSYAPHLAAEAWIVSATKGLEQGTHKRMSEIIHEETGRPVAALTGPNHAEEVSVGQPTATVVATPDYDAATRLAGRFETTYFKAYPRRDLVGAEVCGAYKNVAALAAGMVDGLGWGDNCLACLVTLGVDEMIEVVNLLGGDPRTVYGLAGVGDLVATSTSKHSRNRFYGRELATGTPRDKIERKMHGMVAEGVLATLAFKTFADARNLDLPLTRVTYDIVHGKLTVHDGVEELLARV